ncbi:MAG: hypothetical protein A2251_00475 [Elusimicrobia bacterium RIFOXYA2_FULL_47_53]|nr:MAG: hypothetical protein A2278_00465 [Elusimicrobia bacterium RIFOXYA12_FULL_49_49]OGS11048.1 MAG: hypothetical protein A2386_00445 [Elusimicrobia bacterium RIFOXYB1_FULL_48_9]OGS15188.1 MAG: hypothetical protein A2251_00475 [Elusimicrobia bacterium RIFOXYA2_FULL_47_53]OGS29808.1 MAG: hypothetical protein A2323_01275 [Elusimicrobia bacterium RIFOXYB2_FULL_46_23]
MKFFAAHVFLLLLTAVNLHASEMDRLIEKSANDSYVFKTYLQNDNITTLSNDGVVTLNGTVNEEFHILMAQETVANLPGVKRVQNNLVFHGERFSKSSDKWISMNVMSALLFHHNVNAFKTNVNVYNGVVTLKGEAASLAQKELTGEYAADVFGVKEVKNEMTYLNNSLERTPAEKIDDASITAQVILALLTHRSTSAIKTIVQTKNGVVTLTGSAKNDAEKKLVGKLANDIRGVAMVVNKMAVDDKSR